MRRVTEVGKHPRLNKWQIALLEAGETGESYESLCYRHFDKGSCAPFGVLSIWDGDQSLYFASVEDDDR